MLKKVLLLGALIGAGFYVFGNNKSGSTTTGTQSGTDDVLSTYDNYLLEDKDGYWMVVKNGKVYNPATEKDFYDWQTNNPGRVYPTQLPISIWTVYANTDAYGGTFVATT